MNAYKIKVENETESQQAQELLFELGYTWSTYGKKVSYKNYIFLFAQDGQLSMSNEETIFFRSNPNLEITLARLQDLVILHRNDINDATHVDGGSTYYIGCEVYLWNSHNIWEISSCFDLNTVNKLTPITKAQAKMTWQDAFQALIGGKEVDGFTGKTWINLNKITVECIKKAKDFRLSPKTIHLKEDDYTKEQLLKIAGEMG